jgi:ATP-binding cassette, subfamily G (WHITE), member 2, SNQ2
LQQLQPLRYGFEGLITNEFRTLDGTCALLVPSGPGYENVSIANQVCTTVGSLPGQATVNGNRFVQLSYDYAYSNTWRNFGIIVAFGIAFTLALFFFSEVVTGTAHETSVVLFKRGSKTNVVKEAEAAASSSAEKLGDVEMASIGRRGGAAAVANEVETEHEAEQAIKGQPPMRDVFTWQHLNYTVPVEGGTRQLLDDVSGYVVPGKLTALMGESGAGKVRFIFFF